MIGRYVFRFDQADEPARGVASLIDAIRPGAPPASFDARVFDDGGALAYAVEHGAALRWALTVRGAARVEAEAHGFLDVFLDGEAAL